MSFKWVSAQQCREMAEQSGQFNGGGDENDRDKFREFKEDVGFELSSRGSGMTLVQRTRTSSWVLRDDCPWAIGWIGYSDLREVVGTWKPTYNVHSWAITNDKYGSGNESRNTKTSSNIDTAVKNAKTYLRRPSPIILAGIKHRTLQDCMRKEYEKFRSKVNSTADKVVDIVTNNYGNQTNHNKRLYRELKYLLDIKHHFLDPEFKADVEAMVLAEDAVQGVRVDDIPFYSVLVYESRGHTLFDVVKGVQNNPYHHTMDQAYIRYTEDMLPEDITRKLAVLQMLDSDDYVDGVGVHVGNGMYYVVAE
jgi:hypothetical protein